MHSPLFQHRFAIVTGKGGVGRSTVSLALGLVAARRGLRTCVVQLGARDWNGRLFGHEAPSYAPLRLDPQLPLYAALLTPAEALREYGLMKLRLRAVHNLVFENDIMRRLTKMIPGMNELLLLGKAWHMECGEKNPDGSPAWDLLIIDAPATGHGVSLLRLPQVITEAVPFGPMADDARAMGELLHDPRRTALHVVTLPQELPATEALELCQQARETLGLPSGCLFVNQLLPRLVPDHQLRALRSLCGATDGLPARALSAAVQYGEWRQAQQHQLQRLQRHAQLPVVELPHLLAPLDRDGLDALSLHAEAGLEAVLQRRAASPASGAAA